MTCINRSLVYGPEKIRIDIHSLYLLRWTELPFPKRDGLMERNVTEGHWPKGVAANDRSGRSLTDDKGCTRAHPGEGAS
jgi:hypothetical protein